MWTDQTRPSRAGQTEFRGRTELGSPVMEHRAGGPSLAWNTLQALSSCLFILRSSFNASLSRLLSLQLPPSERPQHSAPTSILAPNTLLQLLEHLSLPTRKTLNKIIFLVYFSSQGNSLLHSCPFSCLGPRTMAFQCQRRKALLWRCGTGANGTEDCNTLPTPCPKHLTI